MKIQSLLALCLAGIGLGLGEVPGEAIQHDAGVLRRAEAICGRVGN